MLSLRTGRLDMETMDRRNFLRGLAGCTAAATAAVAVGTTLIPTAAKATPLTAKNLPQMMESFVEQTQATVVYRRRRRRRWTCWWHRGRRVCGWRYVWW